MDDGVVEVYGHIVSLLPGPEGTDRAVLNAGELPPLARADGA